MRIHVTGGRGFLGRYVVSALEGQHQVEVTDVDDMDVTNREAVIERLADRPDLVCHLAGLTGAAASREQVERFFEVNTVGTLHVLEACRRHAIERLIFLSTLTVHGAADRAVDEDSPVRPRHPYAASKAAAELLVGTWARAYGIGSIVLRATLVAGEGQAEPNAVSQFVDAARGGETIEIYGDGSHRREWLHPQDLAEAVRLAAKRLQAEPPAGSLPILVSPGEPISMRELAERIVHRLGAGAIEHTHPTAQAFSLTTDSDRARKELGWYPAIGIDEIIDRVTAWRAEGAS